MKAKHLSYYLPIALYTVLVVVPMAAGGVYALLYSFGVAGIFSEGVTVRHWAEVLSSSEFVRSIVLSFALAATTTLVAVGSGLLAGVVLRERLQRGIFATIAQIPLAMPAAVAALFVLQVFSGGGLGARLLLGFGLIDSIEHFPSLVHDPLGIGIVLAHALTAAPFFALLFAQLHKSENVPALAALASTLGASRPQRFWRITAPVLLSRAQANIALLFVAVLGSYEIPLLLGLQSPQMLSVLAHRKYAMFDLAEKPQAFVLAVIYAVVVLLAVRKGIRAKG